MDIALKTDGLGSFDSDLLGGRDLETAIYLSLFTNRRANSDDKIVGDYRGGWWGDSYAEVLNDKIGSRLWLLAREKQTQSTLNLAKIFMDEALFWMLNDKVAREVINQSLYPMINVLGLYVKVIMPDFTIYESHYQIPWDQLGAY